MLKSAIRFMHTYSVRIYVSRFSHPTTPWGRLVPPPILTLSPRTVGQRSSAVDRDFPNAHALRLNPQPFESNSPEANLSPKPSAQKP